MLSGPRSSAQKQTASKMVARLKSVRSILDNSFDSIPSVTELDLCQLSLRSRSICLRTLDAMRMPCNASSSQTLASAFIAHTTLMQVRFMVLITAFLEENSFWPDAVRRCILRAPVETGCSGLIWGAIVTVPPDGCSTSTTIPKHHSNSIESSPAPVEHRIRHSCRSNCC